MPIASRTDIEFMGKVDVAGGLTEVNYDLVLVEDGYTLVTDSVQASGNTTLYLILFLMLMGFVAMWRGK